MKEKCPANCKKCPSCQDIHFLNQSLQTESGKEGYYVGTWEQAMNESWKIMNNSWTSHKYVMCKWRTSQEQVISHEQVTDNH